MSKTSTQTDLIRYAYNETGMADADRIQRAIDGDPLISSEFNEIVKVLQTLEAARMKPSAQSDKKILDLAR